MSMYEFHAAHELLDQEPLSLEMGVQRQPSGVLHVAARTDMPRCSGPMFEWWFRFAPDTEQYSWWHPLDHISSEWRETSARTHVGSTHVVRERLNGGEIHDLLIHFVDEGEFFGGDHARRARERGDISGVVCAYIGIGHDAEHDERGRPKGGRMAHIARDTPTGMVLRSRFWLGEGLPEASARSIPDGLGIDLMQHAHTEFKYLAAFLPSLYIADPHERAAAVPVW
jgi:DAPG hydrolase PhiG domain